MANLDGSRAGERSILGRPVPELNASNVELQDASNLEENMIYMVGGREQMMLWRQGQFYEYTGDTLREASPASQSNDRQRPRLQGNTNVAPRAENSRRQRIEWRQCHNCERWRSMPVGIPRDSLPDDENFVCSLNPDPAFNRCDSGDSGDEDEVLETLSTARQPLNKKKPSSLPSASGEPVHHCGICLEEFKDPRLLECFHTFCLKCLKNLTRTPNSARSSFKCPVCRKHIRIPSGGVEKFQRNFYVTREKVKSAKEEDCKFCTQDEQQKVTHECTYCGVKLCSSCKEMHIKGMTSRHTVRNISTGLEEKKREELFCKVHPGEDLRFYCQVCDKLVCRDCKLTDCEGHRSTNLKEKAKAKKTDLNIIRNKVSDIVPEIKNHLKQLCKAIRTNATVSNEAIEKVEDHAHILTSHIDLLSSEIISDIQDQQSKRDSVLLTEKQQFEEHLASLQSVMSQVDKITKTGHCIDFINETDDIVNNLESLLQNSPDQVVHTIIVQFVPDTAGLEKMTKEHVLGFVDAQHITIPMLKKEVEVRRGLSSDPDLALTKEASLTVDAQLVAEPLMKKTKVNGGFSSDPELCLTTGGSPSAHVQRVPEPVLKGNELCQGPSYDLEIGSTRGGLLDIDVPTEPVSKKKKNNHYRGLSDTSSSAVTVEESLPIDAEHVTDPVWKKKQNQLPQALSGNSDLALTRGAAQSSDISLAHELVLQKKEGLPQGSDLALAREPQRVDAEHVTETALKKKIKLHRKVNLTLSSKGSPSVDAEHAHVTRQAVKKKKTGHGGALSGEYNLALIRGESTVDIHHKAESFLNKRKTQVVRELCNDPDLSLSRGESLGFGTEHVTELAELQQGLPHDPDLTLTREERSVDIHHNTEPVSKKRRTELGEGLSNNPDLSLSRGDLFAVDPEHVTEPIEIHQGLPHDPDLTFTREESSVDAESIAEPAMKKKKSEIGGGLSSGDDLTLTRGESSSVDVEHVSEPVLIHDTDSDDDSV